MVSIKLFIYKYTNDEVELVETKEIELENEDEILEALEKHLETSKNGDIRLIEEAKESIFYWYKIYELIYNNSERYYILVIPSEMEMLKLSPSEKEILKVLMKYKKPLTITDIALVTGKSEKTIMNKIYSSLLKKLVIKKIVKDGKSYFYPNYWIIEALNLI